MLWRPRNMRGYACPQDFQPAWACPYGTSLRNRAGAHGCAPEKILDPLEHVARDVGTEYLHSAIAKMLSMPTNTCMPKDRRDQEKVEINGIKALRVSECIDLIRTTLSAVVGDLAVYGEVSEFQKRSQGSLVFFTLKDDESYVRCFMLEHELKTEIAEGMEVIVYGFPSLFKKNGGFHLRVKRIELKGEGALKKQFELTKKKLEAEGLFSPARKRPLPRFPEVIGVITSHDAAALTDVRRVVQNRWPYAEIVLADVIVQGAQAVRSIVKAIGMMHTQIRPDVIILTRGGGSIEDLQAFNSEDVARAMFASDIPIVTGVGHERDVTIADFVADVRGATPSNAAELTVPSREEILRAIDAYVDTIEFSFQAAFQEQFHGLSHQLSGIARFMQEKLTTHNQIIQSALSLGDRVISLVQIQYISLQSLAARMGQSVNAQARTVSQSLQHAVVLLSSHSPKKILERGYSISRVDGKIVRSVKQATKGAILDTTVSDGSIQSTIENV